MTRALITKETVPASCWFYLASTQRVWVHHSDGSALSIITSSHTLDLQWGWGVKLLLISPAVQGMLPIGQSKLCLKMEAGLDADVPSGDVPPGDVPSGDVPSGGSVL